MGSNKLGLKWSGSKRRLTDFIAPTILKSGFARYFEPFCGSAAVFFALDTNKPSFLNDKQKQSTLVLQAIKDDPVYLFAEFKRLSEDLYERGGQAYYDTRERATSAAEWLFLFYCSFNGLIRFSTKDPNRFNAPWGKRYSKRSDVDPKSRKPVHTVLTLDRLVETSKALQNATMSNGDYWDCIEGCGKGDFVYLDPPYSFNGKDEPTAMYQLSWGEAEDRLLSERLKELEKRGAMWILSNVAESRGRRNELYSELYQGYGTEEISYKHNIGNQSGSPNEVKELLIFSANY